MTHSQFGHDQFDEAYPPGIEASWWHIARNRVIAMTFDRHVARSARVLEVGCGTGIVTAHLRSAGYDASGVDLGIPRGGLLAREHLALGQDALTLPDELRSAITTLALFDVIEHLADPPAFLRRLLDAFPNAQQVVISVPARQELSTSFDAHFGHHRRYDRRSLRAELAACGLVPEAVSYFFHSLYPALAASIGLRGRKRSIRFTAPAVGTISALNAWLGSLFALEHRLLPGALVGTSIIAVARRS